MEFPSLKDAPIIDIKLLEESVDAWTVLFDFLHRSDEAFYLGLALPVLFIFVGHYNHDGMLEAIYRGLIVFLGFFYLYFVGFHIFDIA